MAAEAARSQGWFLPADGQCMFWPEDGRSGGHLLGNLLIFARCLRQAGIGWTLNQLETLLAALDLVGLESRAEVQAAARVCLVGRQDQLALFDRLFELFFRQDIFAPKTTIPLGRQLTRTLRREGRVAIAAGPDDGRDKPELEIDVVERHYLASHLEVLRLKDFAELSEPERREVLALLAANPWQLAPRRSRRRQNARRGPVDLRWTLRAALRRGAESVQLVRTGRKNLPRPLVVLCDISGSMEAYARIFLPFLYSLRGATRKLETFVFATRLTRITRELARRDLDEALRRAAGAIRDWGGGTRIGDSLKEFNFKWGRRVLGRGAVVLVLSDGWDRGDRDLLASEIARLHRGCHRLIWLNPLLGGEGYEPTANGIRAILPHLDDFLPVHNLRSLHQLANALRHLD